MFCTKCGAELQEGAAFCTQCGEAVQQAEGSTASAQEQVLEQAQVGAEATSLANETVFDSATLSTADTQNTSLEYKARNRRTGAVVAGIVGVLAAIGVGVGIYFALFAPYNIDDAVFPDAALRSYVSKKLDSDKDGKLSRDEAAAATVLDLSGTKISDLTGTEKLPNITEANFSGCEKLTEANLAPFANLETLDISNSALAEVDLSASSSLVNLNVSDTSVKSLNASAVAN